MAFAFGSQYRATSTFGGRGGLPYYHTGEGGCLEIVKFNHVIYAQPFIFLATDMMHLPQYPDQVMDHQRLDQQGLAQGD